MRIASVLCGAALLGVAAPLAAQRSLDSALVAAYRWRNIGPDRGGRSIAVSGVKGRPREAYFGATGGGLWKTTDGGTTWFPVTDGQIRTASVGAVAVSESNPDVVFIGMGRPASAATSSRAMACTAAPMVESPGPTWGSPSRTRSR